MRISDWSAYVCPSDLDTAAEAGPLATVMAGFNATAMSYRTKTVLLWRASDAQDMAPGEIGVDTIIDKPIGGTALRDRLFPISGRHETEFRDGAVVSHAA